MKQSQRLSDKIDHAIQVLYDFRQQNERFNISNFQGRHLVTVAEILFCKTVKVPSGDGKRNLRFQFQLIDGRKLIVSNTSLVHYEKILAPFLFVKIGQSCIINLLQIKIYKKKEGKIIMNASKDNNNQLTEAEFTISKHYREQFQALYAALLHSTKNTQTTG